MCSCGVVVSTFGPGSPSGPGGPALPARPVPPCHVTTSRRYQYAHTCGWTQERQHSGICVSGVRVCENILYTI